MHALGPYQMGYSYLGAGNKMKGRTKNTLDRAARHHDQAYARYGSGIFNPAYRYFSSADERFIRNTDHSSSMFGQAGNLLFRAKRAVAPTLQSEQDLMRPRKRRIKISDAKPRGTNFGHKIMPGKYGKFSSSARRTQSKGRKKTVQSQVLSLINPAKVWHHETHVAFSALVNSKYWLDASLYTVSGNGIQPYMSRSHIVAGITGVGLTPANWTEFWILNSTRNTEITNLSSAPVFLKLHYFIVKADISTTPMDICYGIKNTAAMYPNVATYPQMVRTEVGQLSSTDVVTDIFKDKNMMSYLSKYYIHRASPEFQLGPNQQKVLVQSILKPYKFQQFDTIYSETQEYLRGITELCYVEIVGLTTSGSTTGSHTAATQSLIDITYKDTMRVVNRSANTATIYNTAKTLAPALATVGYNAQGNSLTVING